MADGVHAAPASRERAMAASVSIRRSGGSRRRAATPRSLAARPARCGRLRRRLARGWAHSDRRCAAAAARKSGEHWQPLHRRRDGTCTRPQASWHMQDS